MSEKNNIKVAVIDMNNGNPNQGMRGIREILQNYRDQTQLNLTYEVFDIRQKGEGPDLNYDIYISSGGPGSPFDGENEKWEHDFFQLLDDIESFNAINDNKKFVFLICHSFQLACRKYNLGTVTKRKSNAFGIFPISLTDNGETEPVLEGLSNPFYSVDSRDWQVVKPNFGHRKRAPACRS
jgi:GMP synthase-like glutamine amidotransferase